MYEKQFSDFNFDDLFNAFLNSGNTYTVKRIEGISKEDLKDIIREVMTEQEHAETCEEKEKTDGSVCWEDRFPICKIHCSFSDVLENEDVVFAGRADWPPENTLYLGDDDNLYYAYKGEKTRIPYKVTNEDYMSEDWFMRMPNTLEEE